MSEAVDAAGTVAAPTHGKVTFVGATSAPPIC